MTKLYPSKVYAGLNIAINLIFDPSEEKLLIVQEATDQTRGLWFLPAGKGEEGETIIETCIRETQEESGILSEPLFILKTEQIIGKMLFENEKDPITVNVFKFIFVSKMIKGTLKKTEGMDTIQAKWVELSEIQNLDLRSPEVLAYVDLYRKQKMNNSLVKVQQILETYKE